MELRSIREWHRPLMVFTAAMAATTVLTAAGLVLDDRVLLGAPIWLKPFKFAVSLTIYALTWAWMLTFQSRWPRLGWWTGTVIAVAGTLEMVAICGQVLRGTRSHFNVATAFDAMVFRVMGTTISVLLIAHFVLGAVLLVGRYADRASASAIRLGMLLSGIGLALGVLMVLPSANQLATGITDTVGAHSVGVPDGGPGMPVTGWSTTGGDLRIPHFVGMHALQVLPLLLLALTAAASRVPLLADVEIRRRLVRVAAGAYAGLLALITWQALRGQPLTEPDVLTLGAFALMVLATALAARKALVPQRILEHQR
ncbi:hypothetical protein [Amycolatopsis magusensis]|uniref:hypothetical protein n=1 Tax=Amycolatopsis magusensis TaxID=882444 RepID=UPI003C2FD75B